MINYFSINIITSNSLWYYYSSTFINLTIDPLFNRRCSRNRNNRRNQWAKNQESQICMNSTLFTLFVEQQLMGLSSEREEMVLTILRRSRILISSKLPLIMIHLINTITKTLKYQKVILLLAHFCLPFGILTKFINFTWIIDEIPIVLMELNESALAYITRE